MTSIIVKDFIVFAGQNPLLAYFLLYVVGVFFGNVAAFFGFWLVLRGYLGPWGIVFVLLAVFLADLTGDILWYSLGRALRGTRAGEFVKNHLPHHEHLERHLAEKSDHWVFLSKFIAVSSSAIIFMIGWCNADFKKFFRTAVLAVAVWLPVLGIIAYLLISALDYLRVVAVFRHLELVFVTGLVLFIAVRWGLAALLEAATGVNRPNGNGSSFDTAAGDR